MGGAGDHRSAATLREPARVVLDHARRLLLFGERVTSRFVHDRCLIGASALSYSTLVSLVPLTAIVLVTFAGFPIFGEARQRFMSLVIESFAPSVGEQAVATFTSFASNAAKTTALGVGALVITAILLLATIEEHLHHIFRVRVPRSWGQRVLAYWAILTLGPVLLGVGLTLSGDIDKLMHSSGIDRTPVVERAREWWSNFSWLVPVALQTAGVMLLYRLIPNRQIPWRACVIGGLLTGVLLELLKVGFAVFISHMSSYSAVYGALAGIPIVLLWMYIFWIAVLLGAEVTACLMEAAEPEGTEP
jgi:membrane protein